MSKLNWGMRACGIFLLWAATAIPLPAQTLTTLHSFDVTDGYYPSGALIQGTDGNLYGTTQYSGSGPCIRVFYNYPGCGTVFKITPDGALTTLYNFNLTDGAYPLSALVLATDGNFYGTTQFGGTGSCTLQPGGCGTVFKITPSGTLTTLHSFDNTDGAYPWAELIEASDGNFYGTTVGGGASGDGTVFKITPNGTFSRLHSFNFAHGSVLQAGLVQGTDGNFYGTTEWGGFAHVGTVFKLTPGGTLTTLYTFIPPQDGGEPTARLVQGSNGNFYGTTSKLGQGQGTVFQITSSGVFTTLHRFTANGIGDNPYAGLVQATDENFYGTTNYGGAANDGTVYKITPSGLFTSLYSFCSQTSCTDGAFPYAELVQSTNGTFYGTTTFGGVNNLCSSFYPGCGTVFSLSLGLGPFAKTLPTSGKVGAAVQILGYSMTGATRVTFNGTAAAFTVVSSSLITTTVPAGATSGTVHVYTPQGNLSSNTIFRVTH